MKLNLKEKNSYLRTLNVVVPWEELKDEYYKEFKKIKSNYSMPGFRKGSVPDKILRKNLGKSIEGNFIDHALNIYYGQALKDLKINPINQGKVIDVNFEELSDFKFDIEFEVMPEFNLPKYQKKINIKTEKYNANEKDVKEALSNLQTQQAKAKSVTGKTKSGQFIYADFGKLNDKSEVIKDNILKDHYIKIGEGLFVGDLEKKILNKKIGDSVDLGIKQENGEVKYRVTINKIEEQVLPEINDEFAKLVNPEVSGIKELNSKILENIQNNLDAENKKILNQKIMDYFVDKTKFEAPLSMVENYKKQLLNQYKEDFKAKNQTYDEEKLIADSERIAYNMIKWYLVKQRIQLHEDVKISKKDLSNHIEDIIKKNPTQKKEIKEYYNKDENKNQLYNTMIDEKIFLCLNDYFINQIKEKSTDHLRKNKGKK